MNRPNVGDLIPIGAVGDAEKKHVLEGKTFSSENDGVDVEGEMSNQGAVNITPGTTIKTILEGYHNGSGYVEGDSNLKSNNIIEGVSIFGVAGNFNPVIEVAESKIGGNESNENIENFNLDEAGILCGFGNLIIWHPTNFLWLYTTELYIDNVFIGQDNGVTGYREVEAGTREVRVFFDYSGDMYATCGGFIIK